MTIQQMAQDALAAQNACNLSGVVLTFYAITKCMRLDHGMDTVQCNTHPICVAFAHKIADMTGAFVSHNATAAFAECERLARPTEHGVRG